jgi:hypothetical protein
LGFYVKELIFLIGKQRNFINSVKAPLSIHQVYKKYTKTEKERRKKKKRRKKKREKKKNLQNPKIGGNPSILTGTSPQNPENNTSYQGPFYVKGLMEWVFFCDYDFIADIR